MENLTTTTTSKSKNKLFKLLQKAIRNLPRKNKKTEKSSTEQSLPVIKTASGGGQMVKSPSFRDPSSPKISCIGQIKHKKKLAKDIHLFLHKEMCPAMASRNKGSLMKPTFYLPSNMRNNVVSKQMEGRKSSCSLSEKAPCLEQMKRFASCHGGELSDFDWKIAQIEAEDSMNEWNCNYPDSGKQEDEDKEEIYFSAPLIGVGGRDDHAHELEPRKEVNLWRRRTIEQLTPLQIRPPCTSLTVHRSRCK